MTPVERELLEQTAAVVKYLIGVSAPGETKAVWLREVDRALAVARDEWARPGLIPQAVARQGLTPQAMEAWRQEARDAVEGG